MKKIGLLGGTFDPIHLGHLGLAETALKELELDMLYIMPARVQPFKMHKDTAGPQDRLNMAGLISKENPKLAVSECEIFDERISYTFDTISMLKEKHEGAEFVFIMGTDSLMSIDKWYRGEELLSMCSFAVGLRPGYDKSKASAKARWLADKYGADITILENRMLPVSSTEIKEHLRAGESIADFVGKDVEKYIEEHGLYL